MSYTSLHYHIVFSTKQRRPWLAPEFLPRVCQYMGGIARKLNCQVILGDGSDDHVHLAAIVHPTVALAELVKEVKSRSSGWIHRTFPELREFSWQEGYAAFTVSSSVLPKVKAYILRQREHHRKVRFQDELLALLKRHGIKYDERYIWG
ncbi:MAG: IS200/IS605 family transposase [Phycisphaerae bacterium]